LFEEHGVDLVLNGDDHLYQRTKPLQDGSPADKGPVSIVNGLGGSDTYEFEDEGDRPNWEAHRFSEEYGTVVLEAYEDRLDAQFVGIEGATTDAFTLVGGANGSATTTDAGVDDPGSDEAGSSEDEVDGNEEETGPTPVPGPGLVATALAAIAVAHGIRDR
jgi:hypothetical protein